MPTSIPSTIPDKVRQQILNALITASFTLHSGKAVLDLARSFFASDPGMVEEAVEDRKGDEKQVGMNGNWGEGMACKSLARAFNLLVEVGEENNAEEVKKVALGRFTKDMWVTNLEAVRSGL